MAWQKRSTDSAGDCGVGETKDKEKDDMSSSSRLPGIIIAVVLCGVIFVVLKLVFPNRSSNWYLNRIKIIASIILLVTGLILMFVRS